MAKRMYLCSTTHYYRTTFLVMVIYYSSFRQVRNNNKHHDATTCQPWTEQRCWNDGSLRNGISKNQTQALELELQQSRTDSAEGLKTLVYLCDQNDNVSILSLFFNIDYCRGWNKGTA